MKLKTQKEIKSWLDEVAITDYTINEDLTVDVNANINLAYFDLTEFPIQFGKVSGNFVCSNNNLTTLKGSPYKVGKDFSCFKNNLTSLEYGPKIVIGSYNCNANLLTTLKGIANNPINIHCEHNHLTNLFGISKAIKGIINISHNKITTLSGTQLETEILVCINNPISKFDYKELENITIHSQLLIDDNLAKQIDKKYITQVENANEKTFALIFNSFKKFENFKSHLLTLYEKECFEENFSKNCNHKKFKL